MREEFRRLLDLPENWNSYGALPISGAAIKAAESMSIVPTCNGGVQLEWHINGHDIEIEFAQDGTVRSISHEVRS